MAKVSVNGTTWQHEPGSGWSKEIEPNTWTPAYPNEVPAEVREAMRAARVSGPETRLPRDKYAANEHDLAHGRALRMYYQGLSDEARGLVLAWHQPHAGGAERHLFKVPGFEELGSTADVACKLREMGLDERADGPLTTAINTFLRVQGWGLRAEPRNLGLGSQGSERRYAYRRLYPEAGEASA